MRSTRHARALFVLLCLAVPASFGAVPLERYDQTADSLYLAGAYDSLYAFAARHVAVASARGDSVMLGRMLVYRGRAGMMLRQPLATRDFDHALAVSSAAGDSLGWSLALGFKSLAASIAGRFDESIALNEQRVEIASAIGAPGSLGWAHILIGYACLMQGKLARAESEYREAVAVLEGAGRRRDALEAQIGLGRVLENSGRLDEGRAAYRRALDVAQEVGDRRQEADCWNNLGGLELARGDLSLAARYFDRAYDLKRADGSFDAASIATNVALANTLIGRYAAAESVLVDAIADARRWRFQIIFSEIYGTLGQLRLEQGRPRGAAVYFRRAIAFGDTGSIAARFDAVAGLAEALAERDSVVAALEAFHRSAPDLERAPPSPYRVDALLARARCERMGGDASRARTLASLAHADAASRDDPAGEVMAALELCAAERALDHPGEALAWFDRARVKFAASSGRSGQYQWREAFRTSLAPRLVEQAGVTLDWPPHAPRAERERALFDVLQEIRARTLMERVTDPRGEEEGGVSAMVTATELQRSVLRPGECLLDISTSPGIVFVFALTRDSLRMSMVDDPRGELERRGRRYAGLAGTPGGVALATDAAPAELLAGVADVVAHASLLVVACDGWVASLPPAALTVDGTSRLIDQDAVSVVPAASLLRDLRAYPPDAPPHGVLAFAPAGASLPGALREVRSLAARYADVVAVESETAATSLMELARDRGIVHVAAHVHVNGERPWHSGIRLGADSTGARYLRASEITQDDFRGRLVVLSSCESALGRETQGEGVLGITTAFLAAGARAVVASLWKVDDHTTTDLMLAFYRGLEDGEDVGDALRAAQQSVRRARPAPFYWAGFVVVGDASTRVALERRARPHIRVVLLIFAVAAAMGAAFWEFHRSRSSPL